MNDQVSLKEFVDPCMWGGERRQEKNADERGQPVTSVRLPDLFKHSQECNQKQQTLIGPNKPLVQRVVLIEKKITAKITVTFQMVISIFS